MSYLVICFVCSELFLFLFSLVFSYGNISEAQKVSLILRFYSHMRLAHEILGVLYLF